MPPQPPLGTETEPFDDVEEVTAEPVDGDALPLPPRRGSGPGLEPAPPAGRARGLVGASTGQVVAQAAAAAATGIVAGVATTAIVRAARGRRSGRRSRQARSRDGVDVLETRTFVVDVHVLGRR
ncbi:hypothetical protein [Paraconexibacter sp.]|uniref:hypothetical protein n=1 Tax=Paraconexibacter sp. TaxID=2949640 RepID=UPI00356A9E4E